MSASLSGACTNHPQLPASQPCAQCGLPFCADCLVPIQGRMLCAACKQLSLRDMQRQVKQGHKLSQEALNYALIGFLVCGPILEPIAILKGVQALKEHKADPTLPDKWKATTAVWLGSFLLLMYVIVIGGNVIAAILAKK